MRARARAAAAVAPLVVVLASAARGAEPAGTLVVLNKSAATATFLDLPKGKVVATVPTGDGPHEAAASPNGKRVLVTNYGAKEPGSTLTLLDVASASVVRTISLGEHRKPHGVVFVDARRALVTSETSKAVLVVDTEAGVVDGAIATAQDLSHMVAAAPGGTRAFVANIRSGTVTALDLASRSSFESVPTGAGAEGIDVTPDGREVWVTNREADTVSVVDAEGRRVVASLPAASFPIRVRITPDGARALVTCARSGQIVVFDVKERKEERRLESPLAAAGSEGRFFSDRFGRSSVPVGVVVSPDGTRFYVAHSQADAVTVHALPDGKLLATLKPGREPDGMAFTPVKVARPK